MLVYQRVVNHEIVDLPIENAWWIFPDRFLLVRLPGDITTNHQQKSTHLQISGKWINLNSAASQHRGEFRRSTVKVFAKVFANWEMAGKLAISR